MSNNFQSPLRRKEILAGLCQSIDARTFVEVGCKEGKVTGFLLQNFPELHAIAIDPWEAIPNEIEDYQDWDFDKIEEDFIDNIGLNKERCRMLRMVSSKAAEHVSEVDMVFIDAGHDYQSCKADIDLWWPKVKHGGIMTGHDYQHKFPGVMRAVADSFNLMDVTIFPDSVWSVTKQ